MDADYADEWCSLLDHLHNISSTTTKDTSNNLTLLQTWQQNDPSVRSVLFKLSNHFNQHCSQLKHGVHVEHPVLSIFGRCMEVMVDVVDRPGSSCVVGQALVCVGLTLLHLLAPKGPVDPVQKATVKLNHFRQEVRWHTFNAYLCD